MQILHCVPMTTSPPVKQNVLLNKVILFFVDIVKIYKNVWSFQFLKINVFIVLFVDCQMTLLF
jgi:hypothetical protein